MTDGKQYRNPVGYSSSGYSSSAESLLSEISSEGYISYLRRHLVHKIKNQIKLSPTEKHLARTFPQLKNRLYAPSVFSVTKNIFLAALPITAKLGLAAGFTLLLTRSLYSFDETSSYLTDRRAGNSLPNAGEYVASASAKKIDFTELAMALAAEAEGEFQEEDQTPAAELLPIVLPKLKEETAIVPTALKPKHAAPRIEDDTSQLIVRMRPANTTYDERTITNDIKHQRNLVKFISGLIAAFRPNIPDCASIARHIVELSSREKIDPLYVAAVIAIESRFASRAESHVGALGLMQLMPGTAKDVAEKQGSNRHGYNHLVDPRNNIRLGISYLKELEQKYAGDRYLALAAYNWGPANVDQKTKKTRGRIPGSVQKYSRTVLERTKSWRMHFDRANQNADRLEQNSRGLS